MCFPTRTPSPPPPTPRPAQKTPRHPSNSNSNSYSSTSTLPTIISCSPSTKHTSSHRHSTSTNTFDTTISSSPRTSHPAVTIQTARPSALTPHIETIRPTGIGYRQRITFAHPSSDSPRPTRGPSSTTATVSTAPRIPRSHTGAPPPAAPDPPRTTTLHPPQDRQNRHTWSAEYPLTSTTKKVRSRGERSVRSAPEEVRGGERVREIERDRLSRVIVGRGDRSDRVSAGRSELAGGRGRGRKEVVGAGGVTGGMRVRSVSGKKSESMRRRRERDGSAERHQVKGDMEVVYRRFRRFL